MKFFSLLATAGLATFATAQRCGTHEPPAQLQNTLNSLTGSNPAGYNGGNGRTVNVYAHVVTSRAKEGQYTEEEINAQIDTMNSAYAGSGMQFTLVDLDFTVNNRWAAAGQGSAAELQMKTALHQGTYADLNLYFVSDLGDGLLGFCYFPEENPSATDLILDGCEILAGTVPGANEVPNYDLGLTAVHEVGHWFGLYHVFQGFSCTGPGDFIRDTPQQKTATEGCPRRKDSCPGKAGLDSIHNYMDYSYDICMTEFSDRQNKRIYKLYDSLRAE